MNDKLPLSIESSSKKHISNRINDKVINRITEIIVATDSCKNVTLYDYLVDNNRDILLFFQFTGLIFRKPPGQSMLIWLALKIWVLTNLVFAAIGYINCMRASHFVATLYQDNLIPFWFLAIVILGLCITVNVQILSIAISIYYSREHLFRQNHITIENVKKTCFESTIIFFCSMQLLAFASLLLYCTKGNNFGPQLNYTYINFSIGMMNIFLTSCLSLVLFFILLSTNQVQEIQRSILYEAENYNLTVDNYKVMLNNINTSVYSSAFGSKLIIFSAILNMIVYLLCIFSIFSVENKELPDSLSFQATDIIAYSGLLAKEVVFLFYVIYISSKINDIQHKLLTTLAEKEYGVENAYKKLNLIAYITYHPIRFEILGIQSNQKGISNVFLLTAISTLLTLIAKVFYFYTALSTEQQPQVSPAAS